MAEDAAAMQEMMQLLEATPDTTARRVDGCLNA